MIDESLAPSQPTDPVFHGVSPGSAPWVLKRGDVRLKRDGKLDLDLKGLVIPALGTPGPVTTVSASLYCGADSSLYPTASSSCRSDVTALLKTAAFWLSGTTRCLHVSSLPTPDERPDAPFGGGAAARRAPPITPAAGRTEQRRRSRR